MTAPTVADPSATLYRAQAATAEQAATQIAALWAALDLANVDSSWAKTRNQVLTIIMAAQIRAAATAEAYQQALLRRRGLKPLANDALNLPGFAGYTGEGFALPDVLNGPPIWFKQGIHQGLGVEESSARASYRVQMLANTETQRAGSRAQFVGRNIEPRFVGFERYVNLPACARCIVLAGRRYRKRADFLRHPNCDCTAIEVTDGDHNEPSALFNSLSTAEQDRVFTAAGARAIRSGADISQVVNVRRGAAGLTPAGARITDEEAKTLRNGLKRGHLQPTRLFGQDLFVTSEGTTVRGVAGKRLAASKGTVKVPGQRHRRAKAPRLMPESIAEIAGDDDEMFRTLLQRFGYIA